ncbi:hypothetical protein [Herminiimonas sp.]|uniref:hypothetical protein n=1 Tax=Herminiimonas sp. TaxID=1926289 RepID=UPI002722C5B2|nr:hypothetical protein [Herminiimonas sp.]MDO8306159.1 hypothetical protein [Herminiimonas sp.]
MKFPASSSTTPATRLCFAALLVVVVLFAQWMGLRHRIEHADRVGTLYSAQQVMQSAEPAWSDATAAYTGDPSHSCALFDGVALADSAPVLPYTPLLQASVRVLALWAAYTSWDAPFLSHFSSRAPPRA